MLECCPCTGLHSFFSLCGRRLVSLVVVISIVVVDVVDVIIIIIFVIVSVAV